MTSTKTKSKPGTKPGTHHLDRRAGRILTEHVSEGPDDELLDTAAVASWLGVSVQWLILLRGKGEGPRYSRLSPKIVKYKRGEIKKWLRSRELTHTGERLR
jgi:predicted DNA-binding transcriptional regulator AlpA